MSQIATGLADKRWTAAQIADILYLSNITDGFRKYNGTSVSTITRATEAATALSVFDTPATGSLINPAIYKWKFTYVNPKLGLESEPSAEVERTNINSVRFTAASIPSPYTHINVYRTVADGSEFFLDFQSDATSGTIKSAAPDTSLGVSLDTTIDLIDIPKGNFIFAYKGFMMVLQDYIIRHSHIAIADNDNYYLDTDKFDINTRRGKISGGGVVGDTALVFTPTSIFGITGTSADDFNFRELKRGIGVTSHDTVDVDSDGNMIAFSGTEGVIRIRENDIKRLTEVGQIIEVEKISSPDLDPVFTGFDDQIKLDTSKYSDAVGYIDQDDNIYHLYVSDHHFIFDLTTNEWSHEENFKVNSAVFVKTSNQNTAAYTTDNQGFLIREDISASKLAPTGTVSGQPTSANRISITDTGANFETIGDGLKGAFIIIDHDTHIESRQIISNSATSITVNAPWDIIPSNIDNYYIGYIQVKLLTKQYQLAEESTDKSRNFAFGIFHEKSEEEQNLIIKVFIDKEEKARVSKVLDLQDRIYDEVGITARSRFIQMSMFTQYNKKTSRSTTPLNITSYVFHTQARGKI